MTGPTLLVELASLALVLVPAVVVFAVVCVALAREARDVAVMPSGRTAHPPIPEEDPAPPWRPGLRWFATRRTEALPRPRCVPTVDGGPTR